MQWYILSHECLFPIGQTRTSSSSAPALPPRPAPSAPGTTSASRPRRAPPAAGATAVASCGRPCSSIASVDAAAARSCGVLGAASSAASGWTACEGKKRFEWKASERGCSWGALGPPAAGLPVKEQCNASRRQGRGVQFRRRGRQLQVANSQSRYSDSAPGRALAATQRPPQRAGTVARVRCHRLPPGTPVPPPMPPPRPALWKPWIRHTEAGFQPACV